ncbi:iron-hydroxamate ABC transporter substrate-binding protein [Listeria monocytogenes]|uniref:iron-hydroxamate ABC transporter substrate-binding protein n=1 Tax=Listeria monocytogenes TaxID=1639 RepID=UPI000874D3A5|nr:iron-hydroxamate ABC transporter substrate-binding protein [Listeria monocytogenes]EAC5199385.1 iron-hydroxamate ABC transporter substrate-binding protein [Listeria monocytogenes]EAC6408341.1 iron-hydroxamate ABC transporter substrate-binding protein [Listeria monocytogenes]EAD1188457.1 iron-hydroxamate ABC transporter substrate-binding protein [Listeria monocytogenes]EAD1643182.1 iron-hydroxamate ABC transporter substrate-binding protein [Listeria monocytogenes]EAD1646035.1 iron-hydroxamat
MKKGIILLVSMLLIAVVLTACGDNKSAGNEKVEMRTYTMANGKKVEIPAHPKRIVASEYLGNIVLLGMKPVGARAKQMENPFLEGRVDGIADIGDPVSAEKVAELKPDLIIVSKEDEFEAMSKIAPTVLIPYATSKNVEEDVRQIADLVGEKKAGEAWLDKFHQKAKESRAKLADKLDPNETVGIYEVQDKDFYVMGQNMGRGGQAIYNALQLKAPTKIQKDVLDGQDWQKISLEVLPEFAADRMFVTSTSSGSAKDGEKTLKDLTNSPIWKNLPTFKAGNVYQMDFDTMFYYDPLAVEGQLDIIVEKLLASN